MENRNTGRGGDTNTAAALDMLALFESVGVQFFDITHTNIQEEKRGFRPKQSAAQARTSIPFLVPSSACRQNNVIIRPHQPPAVLLIQLDDLSAADIERVKDNAFMIVATSPGNHQAWIAVSGEIADRKDFSRRVRKAAGADPTASGATRLAGTANFKAKYAPAFPIVAVAASQAGRTVTPDQLAALGLIAPAEPARERPVIQASRRGGKWPSYQRCIDGAPTAHNSDRPDISRADFTWCMIALDWRHSIEDTAAKLMEVSSKAKENGHGYAIETARNAAAAIDRRSPSMEP